MPCVRATQLCLEQLRDIGVTESGDAIWFTYVSSGQPARETNDWLCLFFGGSRKILQKVKYGGKFVLKRVTTPCKSL